MLDLDPGQLVYAWTVFGLALIVGVPAWLRWARRDLERRGMLRTVGGLTFVKVGRFGGSFYARRSA